MILLVRFSSYTHHLIRSQICEWVYQQVYNFQLLTKNFTCARLKVSLRKNLCELVRKKLYKWSWYILQKIFCVPAPATLVEFFVYRLLESFLEG